MALLAFEEPSSSPLAALLEPEQRQATAGELNAALLAAQRQEREARVPALLKMMLWAQGQLEERVSFPKIVDVATGALAPPGSGSGGA